MGIQWHWLISH